MAQKVKQNIKKQKEINENPHSLFFDCFEKVLFKKVSLVNPNIFKTTGEKVQPEFVQKIPD
jgi:hypothetical protein